jgi:hypothetical protein
LVEAAPIWKHLSAVVRRNGSRIRTRRRRGPFEIPARFGADDAGEADV